MFIVNTITSLGFPRQVSELLFLQNRLSFLQHLEEIEHPSTLHPYYTIQIECLAELFPEAMRKMLSEVALKLKEVASPCCLALFSVMKKVLLALFTCILAVGGAVVGIVIGAMKGQTTETGFLRGAGIGAVSGAVTALQLAELVVDGESLSKVALLCSMVDGKVFMEWVGPAVLKAYQWQVNSIETTYREMSDIYDTAEDQGLSLNCIHMIPVHIFKTSKMDGLCSEVCCSICLQDFKDGESTRRLPRCGHFFHLECVDEWLIRRGSCPICRDCVCNDNNDGQDYLMDF